MNGMQLIGLGTVSVATTGDGGHPPEFYAERIVDRLIHVSDTALPEIKSQVLAYQDRMRSVVLDGIRGAILSDHTTIVARLKAAGMHDAAALVFALHRR